MAGENIFDYLKSRRQNSSYPVRKRTAQDYGISGYRETAAQNTPLLGDLQKNNGNSGGPGIAAGSGGPGTEAGAGAINNVSSAASQVRTISPDGNSTGTQSASGYLTGYNPGKFNLSDYALQYRDKLTAAENDKPEAFSSRYQDDIDDILDTILGRPSFDADSVYDSKLWKNYREQYMQQGNRAMRDAQGSAAGLTGGYGSTYSLAAGQQAYDNYLSQLNDRGLDIYDRLYQQYLDEGTELYNQLGALNNQDAIDYGRYRDDVADYQWGLGYLSDRYEQTRSDDFSAYQADVAQQQWAEEYAYRKTQDALAQQNWEREFAYQQQQDALNRQAKSSGGSQSGSGSSSAKTTVKQAASNGLPPYSQEKINEVTKKVVSLPNNKSRFDYLYDLSQSDGELEAWCRKLNVTPTTKEDSKDLKSPYLMDLGTLAAKAKASKKK